ncbi:MAG TPA: biotin--[acetyl-CoA-carboxylase] ligase [Chitinivibrionales bacterium]|nr:biotin--[acetyl-CoA-carboxylase] ligase [Chitinivibrionales bacterium]
MTSEIDTIRSLPFVEHLHHFDVIESTNNFAKDLPVYPEKGIVVVWANRQTAGRGQRQNTFFSEVKGGLFASVVCPIGDLSTHFSFNRAMSLAIFDGIKALAPKATLSVKWPNDIYWGDKKICGILLETVPSRPGFIVVGFGINVNIPATTFPPDVRSIATSLLMETKQRHAIGGLLFAILKRFWKYLGLDAGAAHLLYANRLYQIGSYCEVHNTKGVFKGVLEDGRMRLLAGHRELLLSTGPVRFQSPL